MHRVQVATFIDFIKYTFISFFIYMFSYCVVRRLYCNQCLVKRKERVLCDRCIIFTMRPLSKIELLKLKPKDLIFYLQSKHVSTTGCVGKSCVYLGMAEIVAYNSRKNDLCY